MASAVITLNSSVVYHLAGLTREQFSAMDSSFSSAGDFWEKVARCEWDFDFVAAPGILTAEGGHASVIYANAGSHTVRLKVTFSDGSVLTTTTAITTAAAPNFSAFDKHVDPVLGSDIFNDGSLVAPWATLEHALFMWRASGLLGSTWGRIALKSGSSTPFTGTNAGQHAADCDYGPLLVTTYGGSAAATLACDNAALQGAGILLSNDAHNQSFSGVVIFDNVNMPFAGGLYGNRADDFVDPFDDRFNVAKLGHVGTQLSNSTIRNSGVGMSGINVGNPLGSSVFNIDVSACRRNGIFGSCPFGLVDTAFLHANGSISDRDTQFYGSNGLTYGLLKNVIADAAGAVASYAGIKIDGSSKVYLLDCTAKNATVAFDVGANNNGTIPTVGIVYDRPVLNGDTNAGFWINWCNGVSIRNARSYGGISDYWFVENSYDGSRYVQNTAVVGASISGLGGQFAIFTSSFWKNVTLKNNAVSKVGSGVFFTVQQVADLAELHSDYNVFWRVGGTPDADSNFAVVNGVTKTFAQWQALGQDTHSKFRDPLFTNPEANDLSLQSTSPCIDAGVTLGVIFKDVLGHTRPSGAAYDIGAYEFDSGSGPITCEGIAPLGGPRIVATAHVAPPIAAAGIAPLAGPGATGTATVGVIAAGVMPLGGPGIIASALVSIPLSASGEAPLAGPGMVGVAVVDAPSGDVVATLRNDKVVVTFASHLTYGVVLQSIENLVDGSKINFRAGPLFRVLVRQIGSIDQFFELLPQAGSATDFGIQPVGYDATGFHVGQTQEVPELGGRHYFEMDVLFRNISHFNDDLKVIFTASLLDSQPDRVLFSIYFDPTFDAGMLNYSLFWAAPILLAIEPFDSDHYLIGMSGGMVTRDPKTDLVGDGGGYRFNTAVGFEPETMAEAQSDRMEVFYPSRLSSALAAYGDRSGSGSTIYLHDTLNFSGRRIRDVFEFGLIKLEHEALIENGLVAGNGWSISGDDDLRAVRTYVRVFKRTGQLLGEDVGLDYRRWVQSSQEGRLVLPSKPKDRPDMATLQASPLAVTVYDGDFKGETGLSTEIEKELLTAFPNMPLPMPWMGVGPDLADGTNYWNEQKSSFTHPGAVGDSVPDLFDLKIDPNRIAYLQQLRSKGLTPGGYTAMRRPTPYDGRGFWDAYQMDLARVQNHLEAANPATRKTTDQWLKCTSAVTAVEYDDCLFTKITLSNGFLDPSLWEINAAAFEQLVYAQKTAGVDHAFHQEHLGWLQKDDKTYAFTIEKQNEAGFKGNPPVVYVGGDWTSTVKVGHVLNLFFMRLFFVPGYDKGVLGQVGDNVCTSLCGMADDVGQGIANPVTGWAVRLVGDMVDQMRSWGFLLSSLYTFENLVCWSNHGNEIPGSNQCLLAWRRILAAIRANLPQPLQLLEEYGPYDWLVGLVDGFVRTQIRNDLTTTPGSWGASPFFQVAWGAFQRMGFHANHGAGHVTNFDAQFGSYVAFWEGATAKTFRESLVSDFIAGKMPTYSASPDPLNALGTRPDGKAAFTPFYHSTFGMNVSSSFAALLARLITFSILENGITEKGQRVRSLERRSTKSIPSNLNTLTILDGHNLPATENGPNRPPIFHAIWRDPKNPRRLVAVFINDSKVPRGDAFTFHPAWYFDAIPVGVGGYVMTQGDIGPQSVANVRAGFFHGDKDIAIALGPGEMRAISFDFTSGLRFRYAYDDQAMREVPIPIDQLHVTVGDLHGSGRKMIFGFANDIPDQDWKIASADLRMFKLGQSESQ